MKAHLWLLLFVLASVVSVAACSQRPASCPPIAARACAWETRDGGGRVLVCTTTAGTRFVADTTGVGTGGGSITEEPPR